MDINRIISGIEQLENDLIDNYDSGKGRWTGKQWMNAAVSAEFLILCKYIDFQNQKLIDGIIKEILSMQNKDGGWPSYFGE